MLLSFDEPKGWFKAGSLPKSYDMGIDKGAAQDGKNAGDHQIPGRKMLRDLAH
jgi:hypothetical protein